MGKKKNNIDILNVANKLKKGDEIRVIAPARSMKLLGVDCIEIANKRFEEMYNTSKRQHDRYFKE